MSKALIIDDEQHCIQRLQRLLTENAPGSFSIVDSAGSAEEAIEAISRLTPDLVFLDIQLGNQTAFDLLEQLQNKDFDIIFTTAYDQYAVQAFKCSAIDYLLKPIDRNELMLALSRFSKKNDHRNIAGRLDVLLHNIKNHQGPGNRICVPVLNGFIFLEVSDIIRCQSSVNYTSFFLKSSPTLVVAKTLKEFEDILKDFNFFRVHNSHLVNLNYVKSYNKGKGGFITMTDNSVVDVSTRRKDQFLKKLATL